MSAVTGPLLLAQVVASFATTATLIVAVLQWRAAYHQMRTVREQLEETRVRAAGDRAVQEAQLQDLRAGEYARNAFELVTYLERPNTSMADG